jgi:serpin B
MKKTVFIMLAIILTMNLVSCGPAETVTVTQTETQTVMETITQQPTYTLTQSLIKEYEQYLKSDKVYNSSPDVDDETLATLVNGNNEFAFDLYRQLVSTGDGNLFFSPYSISLALAMTYAGANGQTKEQMADVLNFLLEDEELHSAFNKLAIELNSRNQTGQVSTGFKLNVINAIWGQQDYKFMQAFLDVIAENYNAGMRVLDFEKDPEGCRQAINEWVSEQTDGLIKELLPANSITDLTRLVLTNAIYFNAAWLFRFDKDDTYDDTFYMLDGSTVTVPMMHQKDHFGYTEGSGYQAIELKYDTWNMSMVIILPDEGTFEEFESSLTGERVNEIVDNMEDSTYVILTMPKFGFESSFNLKETLEAMGMTDAFHVATADFSGIFGGMGYWLDEVYHDAYVTVDEDGTTAAAATGVVAVSGISQYPPEINLNHPFIFMIRDGETNTILFVGRIMNPAA